MIAALTLAAALSAAQSRLLAALQVPVALPARVPTGFHVVEVLGRQDQEGASYVVLYQGPNDKGFAIESAAGGVGGLPNEPRAMLLARALDPGHRYGLCFDRFGSAAARTWLTDWFPGKRQFYRFAGAGYARENLARDFFPRAELSEAEVRTVVESLAVVKL